MKKITLLITSLVLCILLTGCGTSYKVYKNYTEEEIISLAKNYIVSEIGDDQNFNFEIIETKPLEVCVWGWNVCHEETIVKDAYEYIVEVTNTKTNIKESQIIIQDRYYEDNEFVERLPHSINAKQNNKYYIRQNNLKELLKNYKTINYHFLDEESSSETKLIQKGYLYSTNIEELENFLNRVSKTQYEFYWDFLITTDISQFNLWKTNIESYEETLTRFIESEKVFKVDLSYFNKYENIAIRNTSQGSSTCVNIYLKPRT